MSVKLRSIRDRVRMRIRDMDDRRASFDVVEIDQAICESYIALQSMLPAPELVTASAFTISAGGDTFTLPNTVTQWTGNDGGAEYTGSIKIQLASTGRFLQWVRVEQLDAFRNGQPLTPLNTSIPHLFTLWEEKDQDVQGRCYPGAKVNEVCNLFTALKADDLRDFVGSSADDLDDVEAQLSRDATLALVYATSAELVATMDAENLKLRRLNPSVASTWAKRSELLLYQEACRRHDVDGGGTTERWVS